MREHLFWIQHIHAALKEAQEIPLWGAPPSFPIEECTKKLSACLGVASLNISIENTLFRPPQEMFAGMGETPFHTTIALTPLSEPLHLLIPQEEIKKLSTLALSPPPGHKGFTTLSFQEGFFRFLSLQMMEELDLMHAFGDLSIKLATPLPLPNEEALCMDIAVRTDTQTIWLRIVCPHGFRWAFKHHFSSRPPTLSSLDTMKDIDLPLSLIVGQATLSIARWQTVSSGDFIKLDYCSFDPATLKGSGTLTLGHTPLLHVRLKEESLKIVDYAFYYEETMNEHTPEENEPSETSAEEDSRLSEVELGENDQEDHIWASDTPAEESIEELVSTQDIPVTLTVEVARFKMNVDKLLQLKPGNILELPVHPAQGVHITIGGKKVATAELVKLGNVLGIKILHIGGS